MTRGLRWVVAALAAIVAVCAIVTAVEVRALRASAAERLAATRRVRVTDDITLLASDRATAPVLPEVTTTTTSTVPAPPPEPEPPPPPSSVVLWGDSLAAESEWIFMHAVEQAGMTVDARTRGGTAPCDWYADIMQWPDTKEIDVALLEFSGNARTPCMRDDTGVAFADTARVDKYRTDVEALALHLRGKGATVVLVGAPVFRPDFREPNRVETFNELYRELAANHDGVVFVDAGAPLLDQGRYVDRLPCLPWEGEPEGCVNGTIAVRSPDGVHFCPVLTRQPTCSVYSSGSFRFAVAMADAARTPPT